MVSFNKYLGFLSVVSFLLLFSCQSEIAEQEYNTQETITKTTPLTTFIERVVMQKTSQDNIIDNTDCFMIKLPYVITVDNVEIPVNSYDDYELIKNKTDESSNDNDVIYVHFPITVIFSDYSEKRIYSQTDFNNLLYDCKVKSDDLLKINCLSFNYPITIKIYDSNKQIASSVSIIDDKALYVFINNLADNHLIALNFPLTINNLTGQKVTIVDNNQLEKVIKETIEICKENTSTILDFNKILINGPWKIAYFYHDYEKTQLYSDYIFTFNSDYTVKASKLGNSYSGVWYSKLENGVREFKVDFNVNTLDDLKLNWKLFEFNNSKIRFRGGTSNSGLETDYLYFIKIN
jgi:adenylate kinase family enzyme